MNSLRFFATASMVALLGLMWPSQTAAQEDTSGSPTLASAEQEPQSSSQSGPSTPSEQKSNSTEFSGVAISGSLRGRAESWSWFEAPPGQSNYTFGALLLRVALHQKKERFEWMVEGSSPWLMNLPAQAILPAPQGQLGQGANYYAANHNQDGSAGFHQGFVKFKSLFGDAPSSFRMGRFEFSDGAEVKPADATLAALKNDRIQQRLIGPVGFSHVGRSFDGIHFDRTTERNNFTFFAARPVEGVYQLRSLYELDVDIFYAAFTRQLPSKRAPSEFRLFAVEYHDGRPVLKVDNRPLAARAADHQNIRVTTFGGHYLAAIGSGTAKTDLLFWGAAQVGNWGVLTHRAGAIAVEAGHKFDAPMQPWLRAGYFRGSGDGNPNDNEHSTFFQMLPTPRIYARFPFFNLMNNQDIFGELLLKPARKLSLRTDVHSLSLSASQDLWYLGGGAFQQSTFGYTGRPGNAHSGLGTLFDGSLDYAITSKTTLTFYGGAVRGGSVEATVYPQAEANSGSHFVYFEFLQRF